MPRYARSLIIFSLILSVTGSAAHASQIPPQEPATTGSRTQGYPKIVLYSVSWCSHCKEAKEYFQKNSIPYVNRDVEEDGDAMRELTERYQLHAVPLIVIGNDSKILKGFNREEFEKTLREVQDKM